MPMRLHERPSPQCWRGILTLIRRILKNQIISKVYPEGGVRGVLDLGPVPLYPPPPAPAGPLHALVRDEGGGGARPLKARSEVLIFCKQYLKSKNDGAISPVIFS